ncbi:trichohyalin-like [Boleophthalmus pectinirostris]|uniref:trichohyalin-like n=1 Tax=Boleophthalmus pectinirostris TaxID=150288 RepID=UPI00242A8110|nr:trichohyalin-like [Boleophthalmus pectinirostris]
MDKTNFTDSVVCDSRLSKSLPPISTDFRGLMCQNQRTGKRSNGTKGAGRKNKSKSRAKVKEQSWDFESAYMSLLGESQDESTDLNSPELKCPSAGVRLSPSSPDGNWLKTFNSPAPEPELKHQTLSDVSAAPPSASDTRGDDEDEFYVSELLKQKRAERQLKGNKPRRRQSSLIPAPLLLQSLVRLEPEQVSSEAVESSGHLEGGSPGDNEVPEVPEPELKSPSPAPDGCPSPSSLDDKSDSYESDFDSFIESELPQMLSRDDRSTSLSLNESEPPADSFVRLEEEQKSVEKEMKKETDLSGLEQTSALDQSSEDSTRGKNLCSDTGVNYNEEMETDHEEDEKNDDEGKAERGETQVHRSSVSPASSVSSDAPEPHDATTSRVTKNSEASEAFLESLKRREEEEERRLKAESEERLETLRRSLLTKRREAEARLKEESKRQIQALQANLKAKRERQEAKFREEERRMKAENEQTLETLRQSLLAKRTEEEEKLKKEHEKNLEQFRVTLQTNQKRAEEEIRQEARSLKAKYVNRLETIRRTLLERTKEEDRLKEESEKTLERLGEKLDTEQKKQEEKIRKENDASLKVLKTKFQKQQVEMKNKLKSSNKIKLDELRAQLEDEFEFAAEKQRLQKNKDEKLNSFVEHLEEESKALMKAKRDEMMQRFGRKLAERFQKERQEMEQEHEKKLGKLREKHRKERGEIREKLLNDFRDDKEKLDSSHVLDLEKLNLRHQAEVLKRQTEIAAREYELLKEANELEKRRSELTSQNVILKAKEDDLYRKRKDLAAEDGKLESLPGLIRERDSLKEELRRFRELHRKIGAFKSEINTRRRDEADPGDEEPRKSREHGRDGVETRLNLLQEKHERLNARVRQLQENAAKPVQYSEVKPQSDLFEAGDSPHKWTPSKHLTSSCWETYTETKTSILTTSLLCNNADLRVTRSRCRLSEFGTRGLFLHSTLGDLQRLDWGAGRATFPAPVF